MSGRLNRARRAAAISAIAVEEGAHLEDVLAEEAPEQDPDRSLAWFLGYGIQRRRGQIDAALRAHLKQPLEGLEAPVRAALRLGAFELLFARTGRHAAVHQAVEVIKSLRLARASGLVNAVLRRVQPGGAEGADAVNAPAWVHARWSARYGVQAAEAWLIDASEPPPLFVVARGDADALAASLSDVATVHTTPAAGVLRLDRVSGPIDQLPGFDDGAFWVQDLSSVRVADLVGAKPGMKVLDACAAPGGKSFRMAAQGATVFAADRSRDRLALMRGSVERLGLDIRLRTHDWSEGSLDGDHRFDAVLVDSPCSAIGTLRRHPEVKWRRQLVDVLSMPPTQRAILDAASEHVASGGCLVYAVCSPEPEEGKGIVESFLAAHSEFRQTDALHMAPPEQGEDAFFAARLERS